MTGISARSSFILAIVWTATLMTLTGSKFPSGPSILWTIRSQPGNSAVHIPNDVTADLNWMQRKHLLWARANGDGETTNRFWCRVLVKVTDCSMSLWNMQHNLKLTGSMASSNMGCESSWSPVATHIYSCHTSHTSIFMGIISKPTLWQELSDVHTSWWNESPGPVSGSVLKLLLLQVVLVEDILARFDSS